MRARVRAIIGALFVMLACVAPSTAMDRVHVIAASPSPAPSGAAASPKPLFGMDRTHLGNYGQVLDGQWLDLTQRDVRLGFGQLIFNELGGNTSGRFSNLNVTASGGLYVSVGPAAANELGSLYQFGADDANAIGGSPIGATGATQLSADPTAIFLQGLVSSPAIAVGPLAPPSQSGYSTNYLIECQVSTVDQTPQSEQFETLPNYSYTTATVDRDRADKIVCQSKPGTSASSPSAPTTDTGWIAIANVIVASGASSISQGNVTMSTASQFYGFIPATASGSLPVSSFPHGDYVDLSSTSQTKAGPFQALSGGFGSVLVGGSSSATAIGLNTGFSNSVPVVQNASDGGMNFGISNSSTLGYRFFKGTTPSGLVTFDMNGNVIAADGFVAGNGILTASSGVQSLNLCYNNTAGCTTVGAGGVYSNAGATVANGIFTASSSTADLCINNVATCMTFTNGRNNGGDVTAGGVVLGNYGTDYAAAIAFGSAQRGETEIGTSAANSVAGVAGEILRVADCQTVSGNSACSSDARTFFTINNAGQAGFLSGIYAGGAYTQASARRLKRDIHPVTDDPITVLNTVRPEWFNYKTEKAGTPQHLGLIADDTHSDISGPKKNGLDIGALAVIDAAAINELKRHSLSQDRKIAILEHEVALLLHRH